MLVDFTTLSATAWTTVVWFQALGKREKECLVSTVHTCINSIHGDQQTTLLH